eukprot:3283094-Pleurochrysis_carterae.AAC.2
MAARSMILGVTAADRLTKASTGKSSLHELAGSADARTTECGVHEERQVQGIADWLHACACALQRGRANAKLNKYSADRNSATDALRCGESSASILGRRSETDGGIGMATAREVTAVRCSRATENRRGFSGVAQACGGCDARASTSGAARRRSLEALLNTSRRIDVAMARHGETRSEARGANACVPGTAAGL